MGMATAVVNTEEMLLAQAQLLKAQAQLWLCHAHILEVQARHMRAPAHGPRRRRRRRAATSMASSGEPASLVETFCIATPCWSDAGSDAFSGPTTCLAGSIPAKLASSDSGCDAGAEKCQATSVDRTPPFPLEISNISIDSGFDTGAEKTDEYGANDELGDGDLDAARALCAPILVILFIGRALLGLCKPKCFINYKNEHCDEFLVYIGAPERTSVPTSVVAPGLTVAFSRADELVRASFGLAGAAEFSNFGRVFQTVMSAADPGADFSGEFSDEYQDDPSDDSFS